MAERKIYKFSEILSRMTTRLSTTTGISDFTPGSIVRSCLEAVSIFIEYLQFLIEVVFRSFYIDTAEGDDLKNRIYDFGMEANEAVAARDIQTFGRNTPAPSTFIIFAGNTVSTQPDVFGNTINYNVDFDITFVSGAMTATGYVTCQNFGINGNCPTGTITNIPTTISGVDYTTNLVAFSNGASAETDDQIRRRIPIHLNGLQKGNRYGIEADIYAIDGITFVKLEKNNPTNGVITIYISNESGIISQEQLDTIGNVIGNAVAFGIEYSIVTPVIEYVTISLDAEIDTETYIEESVKTLIVQAIDEVVRTNPNSDLFIYDIILAATVTGVSNVKNVLINGVAADYTVTGFKVIRLNDPDVDITINTI